MYDQGKGYMKKILIVGGAGYVGGYLTDVLADGYDVTVYDNLTYEPKFMKNVNFVCGDIRDRESMSKDFVNKFDTVVWLAAIVGDGACHINPQLTEEINETSVKWLVDNYTGKIIFTSTCSVYGHQKDIINEESEVKPLSVYAGTKYNAESYIRKHAKDYVVYRLGTLFGIGDLYSRIRLDLVVNLLAMKAAYSENLSVYGGEQYRPVLHVKDVADATLFAIENDLEGLFNLSYRNVTIRGIAEIIQSVVPDVQIDYQQEKFEDLRDYRVDTGRIGALGFKPTRTIELGVKEIYKVFCEHRIKNRNDPVYSNQNYWSRNNG